MVKKQQQKNVKLKIGEPSEIKVIVNSNISGHVIIKLTNPLVTEPYEIIEGINFGKRDDNLNILSGWSKTITWKLKPNGAWKNGNAPINVFVQFTKIENGKIKGDKMIEFTIADPYILDEQYSGSTPAQTTGASAALTHRHFPDTAAIAIPFRSRCACGDTWSMDDPEKNKPQISVQLTHSVNI